VSGRVLAERLRQRIPGLGVLLVSGYAEDDVLRERGPGDGVAFLAKPFTGETLARRVREVLDRVER
jgi:two-component system cell cycle sensor histidine kinase/response regulator CckA